jgi:hypothetical protein
MPLTTEEFIILAHILIGIPNAIILKSMHLISGFSGQISLLKRMGVKY